MTEPTKELTTEERNLQIGRDVLARIMESMNLSKLMRIGLLDVGGYSSKQIASLVQSPESYVRKCKAQCRREPKTVQKVSELVAGLPDWFRQSRQALLPELAKLQGLALAEYEKQPEMILKHPQLLKQVASQAGVRSDEHQGVQVNINFTAIQQAHQRQLEQEFPALSQPDTVEMESTKDGVYTVNGEN